MDISALKSAFDNWTLVTCAFGFAAIGVVAFALWASKVPGRIAATAKHLGWGTVAMLFFLGAWATDNGTMTQEEKERYLREHGGSSSQDGDYPSECGLLCGFGLASPRIPEPTADPDTAAPSVRSLTAADYAAGLALARIGTNEMFDFSAPAGAEIFEDWTSFGATCDWFRSAFTNDWHFAFGTNEVGALTVFSDGRTRLRTRDAETFLAPLHAPLGVVPAANWTRLAEGDVPSRFWQGPTSSNTWLMTWQNGLLGRAATNAVSFQMELWPAGDVLFRYDLSRLTEGIVTNLVVGVGNGGVGRTFSQLPRNVTSLAWAHLDPTRAGEADPDGDGLSTDDEVLVYHTDPYNADTDRDGLADDAELNTYGSDPLDPHSISANCADGMAAVLGDADPFACPEGSTNTVWEHVFYTGTTNAPFAYPVSDTETAVLRVSVSGTGSGELIVGDSVVPLLGPSSDAPMLLSDGEGDGAVTVPTNTLLVAVGRGVRRNTWFRKSDGLDLALDSDDLLIGELPVVPFVPGWIAFPHTDATVPCIHDLDGRGKTVSLVHGEEFEGLTAAWSSDSGDVAITNVPPVAAEIYGSFSRRESRAIAYTVRHPRILNRKRTVFTFPQTLRFCPQLDDGECANQEIGDDAESEPFDSCACDATVACSCCSGEWCHCGNWECPCNSEKTGSIPENDAATAQSYTNAFTNAVQVAANVLYLYRANEDRVALAVPAGEPRHCCDCPEHWRANYVAIASRSPRLEVVDDGGARFSITNADCTVTVRGVSPSRAPGDASVCFVTNGVIASPIRNYTVLGVAFETEAGQPPLSRYNGLSSSFGYPITVNTNLDRAASLRIRSDVLLTNGVVRLALEHATVSFGVWLPEWYDNNGNRHAPEKALDAETRNERYFTMAEWRNVLRRYGTSSRELNLQLTSSATGRVDLVVEYVNAADGTRLHDWSRQRVTAINPPLLPDYNHDGRIDDADAARYRIGLPYQFWTNEDTVKGDYMGENSDSTANADDLSVNGTYDLMNLFPVAIDLNAFPSQWRGDRLRYFVGPESPGAAHLNVTFADLERGEISLMQTGTVITVTSNALSSASLTRLEYSDIEIDADSDRDDVRTLIAEAPTWNLGALALKVRLDGTEIFRSTLPLCITPAKHMYRWINARPLSGDSSGRATSVDEPFNFPVDGRGAKRFIFLHGANVSSSDAEFWGDQIFKRLWHTGCRVDFYNVDWRSDIGSPANYHENASNAFAVASRLATTITNISGEKVVMAHSLGNMVVSSMIQDYGLQVSKYLMCNSAVPAEAYDTGMSLRTPKLVHPDWEAYPTNSWSSSWHTLFKDDPNDDRRHLGWPGRFTNVLYVAVNFYSSGQNGGDEVLELAPDNDVGILSGVTDSLSHHSWHKQELFKGRGIGVGAGATDWSGWNIEENLLGVNKISAAEAQTMTEADFKTNTVFYCYPASMNVTNIALLVRGSHLALGIPALTPAAGATGMERALGASRNFNLDNTDEDGGGLARSNGWPARANYPNRWLHSDMKDVSYYYNFKLYQLAIEKGGLK